MFLLWCTLYSTYPHPVPLTYLHGGILGWLHSRLQHGRLLLRQLQVAEVLRKRGMLVLDLGVADLGPRGLKVSYFV